jgi:hypothetical protein
MFTALKNPPSSAGFEPANLGSNSSTLTTRPRRKTTFVRTPQAKCRSVTLTSAKKCPAAARYWLRISAVVTQRAEWGPPGVTFCTWQPVIERRYWLCSWSTFVPCYFEKWNRNSSVLLYKRWYLILLVKRKRKTKERRTGTVRKTLR